MTGLAILITFWPVATMYTGGHPTPVPGFGKILKRVVKNGLSLFKEITNFSFVIDSRGAPLKKYLNL
jgi:hypothetical protein